MKSSGELIGGDCDSCYLIGYCDLVMRRRALIKVIHHLAAVAGPYWGRLGASEAEEGARTGPEASCYPWPFSGPAFKEITSQNHGLQITCKHYMNDAKI